MEIFNALPTRSEDAVGIISTMLGAAIFLRGSKFDGISTDLLNATHEYSLDISLTKPRINKPAATTDYIPYNIGNRIQIARENLGMSEDDLAEKLDIHPGDVLTWEDGADQPLAGMVIPLANALKCDPMWLLTGESSNRQSPATPAHQSRSHHSGPQQSDVSDHASHHAKLQSRA